MQPLRRCRAVVPREQEGCSVSRPVIGAGVAVIALILDQLTKWAVLEHVLKPSSPLGFIDWLLSSPSRLAPAQVEILPFFNLVMVWNEGVSFGLLRGGFPWLLTLAALAVTVLFAVWMARATAWTKIIPLALVIGGALGNVIDRARFGAVADFLDFHVFGWHYPAFNLADSCITLGIVFLVLDGLLLEPKRMKDQSA